MSTTHKDIIAKVVVIDDHVLLRKAICELIRSFDKYEVLFEADNGKDFIEKLKPDVLPGVVVMDIGLPEMDGYETAQWLRIHHPEVKILAFAMRNNETEIIKMIKAGAKGYLLKDCSPSDLNDALNDVLTKGFHYSELITEGVIHGINQLDDGDNHIKEIINLNEREITFLKLVCTEFTYKEIADKMCLSPGTINEYRDSLFQKLSIKTRVGLVMYAIKNGL